MMRAASTTTRKPAGLWRYSLRWSLPHKPCPGPLELAAAEVPAGDQCPPVVADLWKPGTGYAVCVDFPQPAEIRRWSDERKAQARRRNLARRVEKAAPLFADELIARELEARPDYFAGKNQHRGLATDTPPGLDASVTNERATQ